MAKQYRNYSKAFDSDLDAILNRVYGAGSGGEFNSSPAGIRDSFQRHERDSLELKDALAKLRDRREKSQNALRMQEEVQYLQEQIRTLRELRQEIDALRRRLDADPEPDVEGGAL